MFKSYRDPAAAVEHEITIDGEVCKVWSALHGKAWKAYGEFRGKRFEGTGSSDSAARANWAKFANYEANR